MSDNQPITESLDRMLSAFVQEEPVTGLAVGVVKDHQMIYAKGFGVKNIRTGEPVDGRTLFHQASVSKTLVATGIMQLAEAASIRLDSPVTDYLPYFSLADERYRLITIRQLLTHTSGMPDEDDFEWDWPQHDEDSLERYVKSIRNRALLWEPGKQFFYSNIGYEILGDVIAKVSGVSFEQYMQEHILQPAGMRDSTFLKLETEPGSLAAPHILGVENGYAGQVSSVFPYNRRHGPSSTLYANVRDMCRYAMAQLNQGLVQDGQRILLAESFDQLWKRHAATDYGTDMEDIGLSWFLGEYKGLRIVSHSGRDTGFRSFLVLLPDTGMAVAVMTNSDYQGIKIVWQTILDVLLGEDVPYVKKSLGHHLAGVTMTDGVEAGLKEYRNIQQNEPERYLTSVAAEFHFIADTLESAGSAAEADKLRNLTARLFPDDVAAFLYVPKRVSQ